MAILISAQGVGYVRRQRAIEAAGSAQAVLGDPYAYVDCLTAAGAAGVRAAVAQSTKLLDQIKRYGMHLVMRGEAQYPRLLERINRPPHLLFCMGNPQLDVPFPIAVVGTRKASPYGLLHTRRISRELADAGVCIVSGLALGVDAAAHMGALDSRGRTIAVLGSALDKMYPPENNGLMDEIIASGGSVISEYAPGTAPTRYSFLERNRIIAGMSLGTLITEGPYRSGASHTARCALEEGREVFAVPGDIDREGSQLPNRLIAEGAHVATCASDILEDLVIEPQRGGKRTTPQGEAAPQKKEKHDGQTEKKQTQKAETDKTENLSCAIEGEAERAVYRLLQEGELDFDALSERTGICSEELGAALMMLELDGVIVSLPGCRYRLA